MQDAFEGNDLNKLCKCNAVKQSYCSWPYICMALFRYSVSPMLQTLFSLFQSFYKLKHQFCPFVIFIFQAHSWITADNILFVEVNFLFQTNNQCWLGLKAKHYCGVHDKQFYEKCCVRVDYFESNSLLFGSQKPSHHL